MPMAPMMSPRSDSSDNQIIFTKSDEHPLVSTFKNENIELGVNGNVYNLIKE